MMPNAPDTEPRKRRAKHVILALSCLTPLYGINSAAQETLTAQEAITPSEAQTNILYDFSGAKLPAHLGSVNADFNIDNTAADPALQINFHARDHEHSNVAFNFKAPQNWDLSSHVGLVMDIANLGAATVQLYLDITDAHGHNATRSIVIPQGISGSYYAELKGPEIEIDTGLRDDPGQWDYAAEKFVRLWGERRLDLSQITKVQLSVSHLQSDRSISVDNIRLVSNPPLKDNLFDGLVDKFGQNAHADFPQKIKSEAELQAFAQQEAQALKSQGRFADRSKYGGWLTGPRQAATGYFRAEKIKGKWALIDPEGYLFFSTGIANVRMDNTSTMTGYDFDADKLLSERQNKPAKPDPRNYYAVPKSVVKTRRPASALRSKLFAWLPAYKDPLGDHYGYRNIVHTGPVKKGETFSFYTANLERKYGEASRFSYLDTWRDMAQKRMLSWGFTSLGNWADPEFYKDPQLAYMASGNITGDFKTLTSGDDYWAPLPDPFDPKFAQRANETAKIIAQQVNDSPWCMGVFIDNELSWGRMGTLKGQYGIVINTLSLNDFQSPTKAEFTRLLKEKYTTIEALNAAWGESFKSWKTLRRGVKITDHSPTKQDDYAILLRAYAAQYFSTVNSALKRHLPNHLYLGARFATWGMTPEVIDAAKDHVDVMSYNEYREIPHQEFWGFLDAVDKPTLIGEFHMGASDDTGLPHPGLIHAADQKDRARMYKNYMETVIDNPNFVGAHWFQYIDSPLTGRAWDGENYNVGFVSITDTPYRDMVEAARDLHSQLYKRRYGRP